MMSMKLYDCKYERKCDLYPDSKDESLEITTVERLNSYDDVRHLVAFIIGDDIYNVCNSYTHGDAFNALADKYGVIDAVVIFLEKNKYWRITNPADSVEKLNTLKEFLIKIRHRIDEDCSIQIDNINPNIEVKTYKTKDMDSLIQQVDKAIKIKENELSEEEKEAMINSIVEQLENRKKESFADKARRYLCGR